MENNTLDNKRTEAGSGNVILSLDLFDLIYFINRKNRKFQAMLLQDIEEVIDKDSSEFKKIRSLVLDSYNNYTRSVVRVIFGNDFDI